MLCYILIKQKKAAIIAEGNLHVTYNLIKNPLFAGFGVIQEIGRILYGFQKTPRIFPAEFFRLTFEGIWGIIYFKIV